MRKTLTDRGVAALKPRDKSYAHPDPELRGHYVRVQPTGKKSYVTVARCRGKQIWTTVGSTDVLGIEDAREKARDVIRRVRDGLPAFEPPPLRPDSFGDVAEQWLQRHVQAKKLRSEREIRRLLQTLILPRWKGRPFIGIGRGDVARLLDEIEDGSGGRQADHVLSVVRAIANWYATRTDGYTPPFVRGMGRTSPAERRRSRILDDDELHRLWKAAEASGTFGAYVCMLLLTAQRRAKVVSMRWSDISVDGVWTIPTEPREKGNPGQLILPKMALDIIRAQPHCGDNRFVFAGRSNKPIISSSPKTTLDAKSGVTGWTLHDCRRTARSLMSRAGVQPHIAERVLGHAVGNIEATYNKHSFLTEMSDALAALAALIESIVHPRDNVRHIRGRR